ncbi:MAG: chemotaxis response regulator protein-glutamate methylesterase [Lachnospiraceae bacterium]|nr:chemotaxis response regulator protein-glutamate methylesterase [Lachnospiraceae bacterium]
MRKIKVLVVEDSYMFRGVLVNGLNSDPGIEVVATANDPYEARDMIIKHNPDVMTLDVEMPKMDGIEFLRKLIPQHPMPVVMVSSLNSKVFDALKAGAVDFVNKPSGLTKEQLGDFIKNELVTKIKIASTVKISNLKKTKFDDNKYGQQEVGSIYNKKVIAIGASTGGTEAIYSVLMGLNSDVPGIVITQHMPPGFTKMFADRLNNQTKLHVKEAVTGDFIKPGHVLIAPGDKQMKVVKIGDMYKVECFNGPKVSGHCPSVDVLFESVAQACKGDAMGLILTGMGADGAKGLLKMKQAGAYTIGQDESSCIVYGMPKVAMELGAVGCQVSLDKIPEKIYTLLTRKQ